MALVGHLLRLLLAGLHSACGWVACRLRWSDLARRHYERVLVLRGSDFHAYVQLGRLAFAAGDYASWRREFEHARRTDPVRFAKLRHPFDLFEPRLAGTDFEDTGDRATWRSLLPFGNTSGRRPGSPRAEAAADSRLDPTASGRDVHTDAITDARSQGAASEDAAARPVPPRDDCLTGSERERLGALGPIRAAEVARCDLDDLARRLSG
jgi:hypothetical protein